MNARPGPPADVVAWVFSLQCDDDTLTAAAALLSDGEIRRAERFRFPRHRRRFVVRRAMRRIVLSGLAGRDPAALDFDGNEADRPRLIDGPAGIDFNASHAEDCGVVVTGAVRLGVDIECLDRDMNYLDFALRKFTPREASEIGALTGAARAAGFFRCWTGKEAYIKALGIGLQKDLASFAVHLAPEDSPGLRWDDDASGTEQRWTFRRLCSGRYVMTIAAAAADVVVTTQLLAAKSLLMRRPAVAPTANDWHSC